MELWRYATVVKTWRYGTPEVRYTVEVCRHGALEARCSHADVEVWRYGMLEARCKYSDAEVWRYGGLEVR